MALLLSGGIIESIVTILGSLNGSIVAFVIIFAIGHVFNMGINIIGTYVHAARLQYLEFFGKFYLDGGKPFRPLAIKTRYYEIINN
jgi:V/A-type H+-transporting ATPase subunit I